MLLLNCCVLEPTCLKLLGMELMRPKAIDVEGRKRRGEEFLWERRRGGPPFIAEEGEGEDGTGRGRGPHGFSATAVEFDSNSLFTSGRPPKST